MEATTYSSTGDVAAKAGTTKVKKASVKAKWRQSECEVKNNYKEYYKD
jgi:hypothetical protein